MQAKCKVLRKIYSVLGECVRIFSLGERAFLKESCAKNFILRQPVFETYMMEF